MTFLDPSTKQVTVFGGSGFLGRHIVNALAKRGHRVLAAVRRPDLAGALHPLGNVGQIKAIQANLRYPWSVGRAVQGADAVINAVGILQQSGRQSYDAVHSFGARAVAEACRAAGISNLVHVSAIGADPGSDVGYFRSKGEGEAGVLETVADAVVMRPSVVFGSEDQFFNRFAGMARMLPALPLIGGGLTLFQPVYVGDVAEAIARTVDGGSARGAVYELGGPEVLTFRQCMEIMLEVTGRKRALVNLPFSVARPLAGLLELLPGRMLTKEQVRMLEFDSVVSEAANQDGRTLKGLGIAATALEIILPTYLGHFRARGQFFRPSLSR